MMWVYSIGTSGNTFHWGGATAATVDLSVAFSSSIPRVTFFAGDGLTGRDNPLTTFNLGVNGGGAWNLFCFTKDCNAKTIKIYQNGVLIQNAPTPSYKFASFDFSELSSTNQNTLVIGMQPPSSNMTGEVDEIAFFDADLSVDPVTGASGGNTVGVSVAPRFLDMYNMGSN